MQAPVFLCGCFLHQPILDKFVNDPSQVAFIYINIRTDLLGSASFGLTDFIKNPSFGKREGSVEKMPIKQPDDVCIEPVETSDSVDQFLVVSHHSIIAQIT